jgi:hypothetical protein
MTTKTLDDGPPNRHFLAIGYLPQSERFFVAEKITIGHIKTN